MHAMEYLWSLERLGIEPGLERIEALLERLGHPERQMRSVHVAGTNGKGSTCCMIERVLREAGYVTGLYTSPHMVTFAERMQIKGEFISEGELIELIEEVRLAAEEGGITATFFEFVTAVAFLYFAKKGVEIAVVEVGMGGLLDATNVVQPEVAVVTNVGLDHTEFLGETKEEIAREKGGVFKTGAVAITGERDAKVLAVLEDLADKAGVELMRAYNEVAVEIIEHDLGGQVIEVRSGGVKRRLSMRLVGQHQAENAGVALAALAALRERGWILDEGSVERGMAKAFWPGRLQVLKQEPLVVADAAHNEDGLIALGKFLATMDVAKPTVLLVGLKQGRDPALLAREVASLFDVIIVSEADFMAEDAVRVGKALQEGGVLKVEVVVDRQRAMQRAQELVGKHGMILITGSIYFVGDMMKVAQAGLEKHHS